jgi:predicted nucleic acid-binding protein
VIVLDASAVVEWLLGRPLAGAVEQRLTSGSPSLHAPHLLAVEVAQVLRRFQLQGVLSAERGALALAALADLDVASYPHEPLLPAIWQLRDNLTAYDAAYVALASALGAPLVTLDRRLASSAHSVEVDLLQ